jgi:hypothetical protein
MIVLRWKFPVETNHRLLRVRASACASATHIPRQEVRDLYNPIEDVKFFDMNVAITRKTCFYLDGNRIEGFSQLLSLLESPNYMYHAFTDNAFVLETIDGRKRRHPVILRFPLKKVIIVRRPGYFQIS